MKLFLSIFLLSLAVVPAAAQHTRYDTSGVEARHFDTASVKAYAKNRDFQYDQEELQRRSLWDQFWDWFWMKYDEITGTEAGKVTMQVIYWLLGISIIAFFILKVSRMNGANLFIRGPGNTVSYTTEQENIHTIAFGEAIEEALQQGNFRLAIRLLYLQNLKELADRNLVQWRLNKTNADYVNELERMDLKWLFRTITRIFEYAWYGELSVTRVDYDELKEQVNNFQNQL